MSHNKVLKTLKKYKSFLISTHVNPDPDALASELAIALYLKALGKRVKIVNEQRIPRRYQFLPAVQQIKSLRQTRRSAFEAAVVVDCGDLDRIGKVQSLLTADTKVINIDHHITNDLFGDVNLVAPKASSTAEVIFDLLQRGRFRLTRPIAILLYLGIMTDTGSFRFENTTAHTHNVAAELLRFKFSVSDLYKKLYETIPFKDLNYFSKVVNSIKPLYGGKVICLELRRGILKNFSEDFHLRDKIFNYLRAIKGVEVLVILTEHRVKETRVNFRSPGRVNVAKLAMRFHGGGHARASGCVIEDNIKNARKRVLGEIKKVL